MENNDLGRYEAWVLTGLNRLGGDGFGKQLTDRLVEIGGPSPAGVSQVYTTLHRLERRGLLVSRIEMPPGPRHRGARRRRVYSVTPSGRAALKNAINQATLLLTAANHRA
jgi:DNA-binding PadR family transcriptional regulator